MGGKNKRKRGAERSIHPRNKYSDNPPDFKLLASLYPSFNSYVFYSRDGRPRIDWTDFNATRELTRLLLLHDHGINWWIPDGQLCPTVPNRSNYIHWIEDLLSSDIITNTRANADVVKGFDIGTGANCIYPLLGASLLGWSFVGSDVTDVALEWAQTNVQNNPHVSKLIEIRKVESNTEIQNDPDEFHSGGIESYHKLPVLLGVVKDGEIFDFCMCNPPFFETLEEGGLNPKTSCGGTPAEMVCPGGEQAFISRIIKDSVQLNKSFRWYTSMVGRKTNLKTLTSKLREVGVTIVKTTEFVQGQTCRWGLAWSFVPPSRNIAKSRVVNSDLSFMLEGIQRQYSAIDILQSAESFFSSVGAFCKSDVASFQINIRASKYHCDMILNNGTLDTVKTSSHQHEDKASNVSDGSNSLLDDLHFRISVFQQIPGTLLVRGSLQQRENQGMLLLIFQHLEHTLRNKFCRGKVSADMS
ncbi:uncharacterized protein LOC141668408 isoform X1 [Apium graveolens]|uniref:uncharacterized protein LOC141668408 isoform X1 n=1 Tax=Apium graveolens TaxID=4045 RepID=UPI003D79A520